MDHVRVCHFVVLEDLEWKVSRWKATCNLLGFVWIVANELQRGTGDKFTGKQLIFSFSPEARAFLAGSIVVISCGSHVCGDCEYCCKSLGFVRISVNKLQEETHEITPGIAKLLPLLSTLRCRISSLNQHSLISCGSLVCGDCKLGYKSLGFVRILVNKLQKELQEISPGIAKLLPLLSRLKHWLSKLDQHSLII